ncbi:MAG: hypothetical protein L0H29_03985 [Sinobacteraceae bacterium]|nr:hypothetical protein [Nevskiaceae bacterium]
MTDMAEKSLSLLQKLGFSAYEAKAWLALAQAGGSTLNGYEVAKHSGVPRANIYPVLRKLVERGAARRVDASEGARYVAVPAEALLERIKDEQDALISTAHKTLPRNPPSTEEWPVYALRSEHQVYATAQRLVEAAQQSLFIALQPPEARQLAPLLRAAADRGIKITTLCMEACPAECGGCQGHIHRCKLTHDDSGRWLLIVADETTAMTAEIDGHDSARGIETHQPLVVQLVSAYIRQSTALAILGGELGDRFQGLVSLHARQLLGGLLPIPHEIQDDAI